MSSKDSIEFSSQVGAEEADGYLEALGSSLPEGRALVESGRRPVSLELGPSIKMELEAESDQEKGKSSIEISLSWRAEEPAVAAPSLLIVAGGHMPPAISDDD